MKFTTLIPLRQNNGLPFDEKFLRRVIDNVWRPFGGMSAEGEVAGHWIDSTGTEFTDTSAKISIECDRSDLPKAIRLVKRAGRKLKQLAMYFEVSGYDGVQILEIVEPY